MTLVEVVAGLALLATLLTSVLAVKGRVIHQNHLAQRRIEAVTVADQLLARWWQNPASFPITAAGAAPNGFQWRTLSVANANARGAGASVARLEIFDDSGVDVSVEVLVPLASQKG